jgi:hypothetical protein
VKTKNAIVVQIHGAYWCHYNSTFNGSCNKYKIDKTFSHLSHYREKFYGDESNKTISDNSTWKFKDELIEAVEETLKATSFKP